MAYHCHHGVTVKNAPLQSYFESDRQTWTIFLAVAKCHCVLNLDCCVCVCVCSGLRFAYQASCEESAAPGLMCVSLELLCLICLCLADQHVFT